MHSGWCRQQQMRLPTISRSSKSEQGGLHPCWAFCVRHHLESCQPLPHALLTSCISSCRQAKMNTESPLCVYVDPAINLPIYFFSPLFSWWQNSTFECRHYSHGTTSSVQCEMCLQRSSQHCEYSGFCFFFVYFDFLDFQLHKKPSQFCYGTWGNCLKPDSQTGRSRQTTQDWILVQIFCVRSVLINTQHG